MELNPTPPTTPEEIIIPETEENKHIALRKSLNLFEKINKVMEEVRYINTDTKIQYKSTNYKALSNEKVVSVIRERLVKWGLVIVQTDSETIKIGNITSMKCYYEMINIDAPDQRIQLVHHGDGADSQDKGPGKASTYAYKYMLIRTFALPFGDDPDSISSDKITDDIQQRYQKLYADSERILGNICKSYGFDYANGMAFIAQQTGIQARALTELDDQQLTRINNVFQSFKNIQ